jgi:hypothetical protein
MIVIIIAMQYEAAPLTRALGLLQAKHNRDIYSKTPHTLLITGLGRERALRSLSDFKELNWQKDFVVNFGLCGAPASFPIGALYVIEEIEDAATGKIYRPLYMPSAPIARAALLTVEEPVDENSLAAPTNKLVDMEASAIAEIAERNGALNRLLCIKIVMDHFQPVKSTRDKVAQLIEPHISSIIKMLPE